jgi:hypothetical protein
VEDGEAEEEDIRMGGKAQDVPQAQWLCPSVATVAASRQEVAVTVAVTPTTADVNAVTAAAAIGIPLDTSKAAATEKKTAAAAATARSADAAIGAPAAKQRKTKVTVKTVVGGNCITHAIRIALPTNRLRLPHGMRKTKT